MTFLTVLGVIEILCNFRLVLEVKTNFRLVLEVKTGKGVPKSPRLDFLEKFLVNNFALPDGEDNPSRLLSKGNKTGLPFLRTLLVICQKSQESRF